MSKTSTTETATAEANRALVRGAYDAFPAATSRARWLRSPKTSCGKFRVAGHCRATTVDTPKCSGSSSTS